MKKALIFGASGQAGSYLSELLVAKGYEVYGTWRHTVPRDLTTSLSRHIYLDMDWLEEIEKVIREIKPDEIYNLAARMFAPVSWKDPLDYLKVNTLAVGQMLNVIRRYSRATKFFQAGSAEVFDLSKGYQTELTPINPRNPYGVSKAAAQHLVKVYRDKGLFVCTGILFNMESPRRASTFFVNKVIKAAVAIKNGSKEKLVLGNINAFRDWGLTREYVEAMWLMLQAPSPVDYVIGTGNSASCHEFVKEVFNQLGLAMEDHVVHEPLFDEPVKGDVLWSHPTKIKTELGWEAKSKYREVITELVMAEMQLCKATADILQTSNMK